MNIKATFDVEKNQIRIAQSITYFNKTNDTLQTIYLNDWSNSFATKSTPLAKRFSEEFKTEFHFAKNEDRGYSVITSIHQNNKELRFDRVKEHIDVVKVELENPLLPHNSYTIQLNYIVQVPNDKFTRYGVSSFGDYNLRYWYVTPAIYNGDWQYSSHKDLDDMFVPASDIRLEVTCPLGYYLESELDKIDYFHVKDTQTVVFSGKNRVNSKLFLNKLSLYREIETDQFTIVSNVDDENLSVMNKALVTDKIVQFLTTNLGEYPHERLLITDIDYRKSPNVL